MKNKKMYLLFGIVIIMIIVIIQAVNAFGIASAYSAGNPLKMYPGETRIIPLNLGTTSAEGNLTIKAEMSDNAQVASFVDNNLVYKVNVGQETPVNVKVIIGDDVLVGGEKNILIKFYDMTTSSGGMIAIGNAQTTTLKAFIVEKPVTPEETPAPASTEGIGLTWWILGIVAVIAIIAIIWFVVKSKKD